MLEETKGESMYPKLDRADALSEQIKSGSADPIDVKY
jgi:hypothetical protein